MTIALALCSRWLSRRFRLALGVAVASGTGVGGLSACSRSGNDQQDPPAVAAGSTSQAVEDFRMAELLTQITVDAMHRRAETDAKPPCAMLQTTAAFERQDPWGNALQFECTADNRLQVRSWGQDKQANTDDDFVNGVQGRGVAGSSGGGH